MNVLMDWKDERNIDRLKELAAMGLSLGEMAMAMRCSRNTIAGKLYRLGLVHPKPETWTKERIDQLKSMWANGFSKREIATQVGLSKATVFSKATKIGLRGDRQLPPSKRAKRSPRPRVPKIEPPRASWIAPPPLTPEQKEYIMGQGKPLMDLAHDDCRWPLNEPKWQQGVVGQFLSEEYFFCAEKKHGDLPFCKAHAARAYNAPAAEILRKATERLKKVVA